MVYDRDTGRWILFTLEKLYVCYSSVLFRMSKDRVLGNMFERKREKVERV